MDDLEIKKILEDHEKRICFLEKKKPEEFENSNRAEGVTWYRKGSTTEKILSLGEFFNQPRNVKEILNKLKEKDYHFRASDITLPLRNIVRNGNLKKTKILNDGTKLKKWAYIKEQHENK